MIKKLLIANRGEIAVRIVRACAEMGVRSVAVFSEADRHALHVKRADEAYFIGEDPLAGYLNPRKLVNLAVETGCDALHPGYGFLSENAELAEICAERGIKFVGPSADVIRRMGDKTEARRSMIKAGVPVTPGTEGNVKDLAEALREAERIGYPVMLKATSGGGGRGIRRCNSQAELESAYPRVISEATKAFGSAEVFLEKCIVEPKHIEAQVLADSFGNTVHLFERDCSIQRRNQKLIEIAPSPQLTPEQRAYIGDLAVRAAKAVGYENAGTVEFLLGNKNAAMLKVFAHDAGAEAMLRDALEAPGLYDEALRHLARTGHPVPARHLERDWTRPHVMDPELVPVFERIYADTAAHWEAYHLCEDLVDLETEFQLWRFRHMRTVMRIIGFKRGTGGSSGVGFLKQALELTFFPELFEVRTHIGPGRGSDA